MCEEGGANADHVLRLLRNKIDEIAQGQNFLARGQSAFDPYGRVLPEYLKEFCPEYVDVFFHVGPSDKIERHELLPRSTNEYRDTTLPAPMNMVLHRTERPAVCAYSMKDAELFVSPSGYQLINSNENWFWPSASPRALSKLVTSVPVIPILDDIVIIQDRYPSENFAHFLFDWITRLSLFLENGPKPAMNCLFLMGGIFDEFRRILLDAVKSVYGIEPDQYFFPEDAVRLRTSGTVYWFSDQVESYMHPAQMAHPKSIELIKRISAVIDIAEGPFDRIYISRSDAGRRRVANEGQLWSVLRRHGFEMVRLADHRVDKQISLIRGAKHIVAPHGMGLAHIALHHRQPSILELFHRGRGGDDYALISKAMGFDYQFILGEASEGDFDDFVVPADLVTLSLARLKLPRADQYSGAENLLPYSADFNVPWHPGWQAEKARTTDEVPALIPGNAVMRHIRVRGDGQLDSNCGAWSDIPVESSRIYTASCWVWLPRDFDGERVFISLGEWPGQAQTAPELSIRDNWQRITATATAPAEAKRCHVVLRMDATDGAIVFSSCWQLEVGPEPSDYRATKLY